MDMTDLPRASPMRGSFGIAFLKLRRNSLVSIALEHPEKSPRQLAWHITDECGYFISESSVYRILKSYDLVPSPAYIVMAASDTFRHPTRRVHELWQTDFTYFKIVGWGWYYLGSVLDDYSRYVISWKLFPTMSASDVRNSWIDQLKRPVFIRSPSGIDPDCYRITAHATSPVNWRSTFRSRGSVTHEEHPTTR